MCVISGFLREIYKACILVGYYAACSGNSLPTFRDNVSVPFTTVIKSYLDLLPLKVGAIGCPETSVRNHHHMPRNIPEDRRSHYAVLRCFGMLAA
jgi:hypothetical protein